MERFVHLFFTGSAAASFEGHKEDAVAAGWFCAECGYPLPDVERVDVVIEETRLRGLMSFVYGYGVVLVHDDLLARFEPKVIQRDLRLGCVSGPRGPLRGWQTVRGRRRVIVRGCDSPIVRRCSFCGRDVYFAMGEEYLATEPPEDADVFESHDFGIVARRECLSSATFRAGDRVGVCFLDVESPPRDGLGELCT